MRRCVLSLLAMALLAGAVRAEATVFLKNGQQVTGRLIESGDTVGVVTGDGLKTFRRHEIDRIERDGFSKATPAQVAEYRRAERSADRVSHPAEAVAIWQGYLDGLSQDHPLRDEASKQLTHWREGLKQGKVVWAGALVDPVERVRIKREAQSKLESAVRAYRAGETAKASGLLREAMRGWPDHLGIRFFMALTLQKQRKPVEAARHYRAVIETSPDHVPTLNNLAALDSLRRQFGGSVPMMLRAVKLAGDVVIINDNAHKTLLRIKAAKLRGFESRIAELESVGVQFELVMGKQGLMRWGTAWIPQERYREIEARNREIDAQLAALADEVNTLNGEITLFRARIIELRRARRSAPTERDVVNGVDTDGDGTADFYYARDTLTKEKIDLLIVDHVARLAGHEAKLAAKLAQVPGLRAARIKADVSLDFVLIEDPGDLLLQGGPQGQTTVPLVASYVGPTSVPELVAAIRSGRAIIVADTGTFLGKVTSDVADAQSVLNPQGMFGSATSEFSLMNPTTRFTRADSDQSVIHPGATRPPKLFFDGNLLAYVTENAKLKPRIRLADVLGVLRRE
jgi:hypothetical protein